VLHSRNRECLVIIDNLLIIPDVVERCIDGACLGWCGVRKIMVLYRPS